MREWISVNDRLPEDKITAVLITDGNKAYPAIYNAYKKEWTAVGAWDWIFIGITHWMPLPEPPK